MSCGENIKRLRKQKNMTQQQLADRLHVTQGAISQWEVGKTFPDHQQIAAMAKLFGVTVSSIMDIDEFKGDPPDEDDVMALREKLRRSPEMRTLFSAAEKATPEHIRAVVAMLKALEPPED